MVKKIIPLSLFIILLVTFSCKKKEEKQPIEPDDTKELIVSEHTKVMDQQSKALIQSIDLKEYTFVFNGNSDLVDNLEVGQILVDSASNLAPEGYLRRIVKIDGSKGNKTIYTEQARLTEAVLQGKLNFHSGTITKGDIKRIELADGVQLDQTKGTDFTVFDFSYEMEFGEGQNKVSVSGNTSLSMDIFFNFEWEFDETPLPHIDVERFETGVELDQSASIDVISELGFDLEKQEFTLATYYFNPWTFMVGPVPVVFVPKVELVVDLQGKVTAVFSTGVSESFNGRAGTRYTSDNGWEIIAEKTFDYDYYPPDMDVSVNVTTGVGPKISLKLYGVMGPFTNAMGCLELNADLIEIPDTWNLDLDVGLKTTVGVEVDILFFEEEWSDDFWLFKQNLMHLENESMSDGIFFIQPSDGMLCSQGSDILLKINSTGSSPEELKIYCNDHFVATVSKQPWEYLLNTTNYELGTLTIKVDKLVNGQVTSSDEVSVNLVQANWQLMDLSIYNQGNQTINYDVFFSDVDNGWMCGGTGYGLNGYLLHTTNGGESWIRQSPEDFILTMKDILYLNEDELLITMFDGSVFSTNSWDQEFGYTDISGDHHPTFEMYSISSMAMSSSGKLKAIGQHILDNKYYLLSTNPADPTLDEVMEIEEYCEVNPAEPNVFFSNDKGIVYNIKSNDNGLRQYIMLTEDGGFTWNKTQLNASGITREDNVNDAFFINEQQGWLVGEESQDYAFVLITNDGGNTWEKIKVEEASSFGSVHFVDNNTGYATVNTMNHGDIPECKLYKSEDGGLTWNKITIATQHEPLKRVNFTGPYLGYAVGQGINAYRYTVE